MTAPAYRTLGLTVPVTEVLDPELWRARYAHGIALGDLRATEAASITTSELIRQRLNAAACDAAATPEEAITTAIGQIPDEVIRWHLRAALSELEVKLGIPMGIEVVKSDPIDDGLVKGVHYDRRAPRRPYTRGDTLNWFRIDLEPSVISVERVRAYYYGTKVWEYDGTAPDGGEVDGAENRVLLEWPKQGVTHTLPIALQGIVVANPGGSGNYGIWETINLHTSPVPGFWAVDYTVGPIAKDGEPGRIEAVLAHWVYCVAGITLLSMGGLAQSKGLTSSSISLDGVSRSVGLQASAIYGINSALENVFEKAEKRINWEKLRAFKRGLRVIPFSY